MRSARQAILLLAPVSLAPVAGCAEEDLPPPGQIVLYVSTDAPLPPGGGVSIGRDEPTPLFDRVRIEIYEPHAAEPCTHCVRDFELTRDVVDAGDASVGIAPPLQVEGFRARVRMFRAAVLIGDQPRADSTVDVTVRLPAVEAEGIVDLTVFLPTDAVASRLGTPDTPVEATRGRPAPGGVGTWVGASRVPCDGAPGAGEVCVPGGAYWMGNPSAGELLAIVDAGGVDQQRLVVLPPFYMDATEVTVGAFASANLAVADNYWTGGSSGADFQDWCTYGGSGERDGLPMSCVNWEQARAYCQARGADLPSEAQYEYVASDLGRGLYVWGEDEPTCADAVFARSGVGVLAIAEGVCRPPESIGGPLPAGSGARDRLDPGTGGEIVDLAANLAEWTVDRFEKQGEPCWGSGVLHDPVCAPTSEAGDVSRAQRGGSWRLTVPSTLRAATRTFGDKDKQFGIDVGFRCVRRGTGAEP